MIRRRKPPASEPREIQVKTELTRVVDPIGAGELFTRILRAVRREEERLARLAQDRERERKTDDAA